MPQASDELISKMGLWFGNEIDDSPPMELLKSHGWKLNKKWEWEPPTPSHTMSCYENYCIRFLVEEWDFGDVDKSWIGKLACLCGEAVLEDRIISDCVMPEGTKIND